jgi:hypothetical protein
MSKIQVLHQYDLLQNPQLENFIYSINQEPIWKRLKLLNSRSQSKPYPHFLYKYRPLPSNESTEQIKQLRDYLVESRLWLSSPSVFNDPFDMRGRFSFEGTPQARRKHLLNKIEQYRPELSKKQKELAVSDLLAGSSFAESLEKSHENSRKSIGVCSFASNPRNILMWAHYASNHSGVCLQFKMAADISIFSRAISVEYSSVYPVVNYFDDIQNSMIPTLFRKSVDWEYEGERRIIHPYGANCFLEFKPESVSGLILGCQLIDQSEIAIKKLLFERNEKGFPPIKIYRASRHDTKYHLRLECQRGWL